MQVFLSTCMYKCQSSGGWVDCGAQATQLRASLLHLPVHYSSFPSSIFITMSNLFPVDVEGTATAHSAFL